jgi:hypothetical protein
MQRNGHSFEVFLGESEMEGFFIHYGSLLVPHKKGVDFYKGV